ncbi:MAG TPA: DUF6798 domain-containing protein [Candidatus Koribacter sp.]
MVCTFAAILIHGYHLGIEDQAIYLPGVRFDLNGALYPHDAEFFLPQVRPTLIDEICAWTSRYAHISVAASVFFWHLLSVFLLLWAGLRIARRCFAREREAWAGVALLTVLLTIPVTGTALYIVDQYLHPRTLATAFILFAIPDVMEKKWVRSTALVVLAAVVHIQMAFFGAGFLVFLVGVEWLAKTPRFGKSPNMGHPVMFAFPLASLFERGSPAWREAMLTRDQHFLLKWQWYEWVGIFAPLALLWWIGNLTSEDERADAVRRTICRALFWYGSFCFVVAMMVTIPQKLERLTPYQPMRGFHLLYLLLFLFLGGLVFERVLRGRVWVYGLLLAVTAGGMFAAQRDLFSGTRHIEWPGADTGNRWVRAFVWIRENTPQNAYFAIDPRYMQKRGEDEHGFRAWAERSVLADWDKDPGVVCLFPAIAGKWQEQVHAQDDLLPKGREGLLELQKRFGADWVIGDRRMGLTDCPYQKDGIYVCRIE